MIFLEPILVFLVFTACQFVMFGDEALLKAEQQGVCKAYCLKLCAFGASLTVISYILGAIFNG